MINVRSYQFLSSTFLAHPQQIMKQLNLMIFGYLLTGILNTYVFFELLSNAVNVPLIYFLWKCYNFEPFEENTETATP